MKYFENQRLVYMDCWAAGNDNHEKLQFDEFEAFLEEKPSNHPRSEIVISIMQSLHKKETSEDASLICAN